MSLFTQVAVLVALGVLREQGPWALWVLLVDSGCPSLRIRCGHLSLWPVPVGGGVRKERGVQWGGCGAGVAEEGGCLLLSGLSGLWDHEMTSDLLIPLPVQSRLHQNCSELIRPLNDTHNPNDTTWCSWSPFGKNGTSCFPTPRSPPPGSGCPGPERPSCRGGQVASFLSLLSAFRPG